MSITPPRPRRSRLVDLLAVIVLLAVSTVPLWPIYQHPAIIWLAGVGIATGALVAYLAARWPAYAVAALTVLAYVLIGVPLAVPTQAFATVLPTTTGLRDLAVGTVTAWHQMLTVQVPFGTYEALLVPALVTVLVASVVGVSITMRAKQPGWAVLAPLAVLVFGISFGSDTAVWPQATGIALVAVALTWATLRADPIRTMTGFGTIRRRISPSTIRRYFAALALVAVCGTAAVAVNTTWPTGTHRDVLRQSVTPPFDVRHLLSPLVGYRNHVLPPGSERLLFTAEGVPDGVRVRLATLDSYNGMVFIAGSDPSSGSFERVPYRIEQDAAGDRASITVTLEGEIDGSWLPMAGNLVDVDFTTDPDLDQRFFYNTVSAAAALRNGLEPTTYTIDTIVQPMPPLESLASATPGPAHQATLESVPQAVLDIARSRGKGDSPGERLVALTQWLHSGYVSHSGADEPFSRSGHSAERLTRLLDKSDLMLGDAEQYATVMALLAREVGFPSRVVVGYAPEPGQSEIHGSDTTAWVEVQVADGTWVGLDPNPEPRPVPVDETTTPEYVANPETVLPPPPPVNDDPVTTQNDDGDKKDDPDETPGWLVTALAILRVAGIGGGILALVSLPIWVLGLTAWVRRRGRRRRDRRRTVVTGGWNEIRDAMIDRGYDIPASATRQEIAGLSGSPKVQALAERADRGVFAGEGFRAKDVGSYWSQVRAARRSLDAGTTRRERFRRLVTLKSARSLRHSYESWRRARGKGRP